MPRSRRPRLALPQLALMDLDGTLVDTVPDLAFCTDAMLEQLGRPLAGETRVRQWVGDGLERLVHRALTGHMHGHVEAALRDRALTLFLDLYDRNLSVRSRMFPGVAQGLDFMVQSGVKLACITNKATYFAESLLDDLSIRDRFELVLGGDALPGRKPDPLPLQHALAALAGSPELSLLIGDSSNDVQAARAAGMPVVCVTYGYNHGQDIREAAPDVIIDSLAELPSLFTLTVRSGD